MHKANRELRKKIVEILYYPTIQPFDSVSTRKSIQKTGRVLVAEEASFHGTLFDRVIRATLDIENVSYAQPLW